MRLCDPALIAALISTDEVESPKRRGIDRIHGVAERASHRRGTCHCGSCKACVQNAKWDRIFTEKFADPDYYKPREMRGGSSLGWLRSF